MFTLLQLKQCKSKQWDIISHLSLGLIIQKFVTNLSEGMGKHGGFVIEGSVKCAVLKNNVALLVSILSSRTFGVSYPTAGEHCEHSPSLPGKTQNIVYYGFVCSSKAGRTRPWAPMEIRSGIEAWSVLSVRLSVEPWRYRRDTCHPVCLPVWTGSQRLRAASPMGLLPFWGLRAASGSPGFCPTKWT